MKDRKRRFEIFSVSFLDIICCGFGAIVLLVLLSKQDVDGGVPDVSKVADLLNSVITAESEAAQASDRNQGLRKQIEIQQNRLSIATEMSSDSGQNQSSLEQQLDQKKAELAALQSQADEPIVEIQPGATSEKVVEVGGIPVDAEYIIFIVDTSGSMQVIWHRVIQQIENILDIHPEVHGFQIMNDMGNYLISRYSGKWIPDTPSRRKSVLSRMRNWLSFSNSSPMEGITSALRTYVRKTQKLSIYVFGDDYSGPSYDDVLNRISSINLNPITNEPRARIHGIGFLNRELITTNDRFAVLMREVARQNRGAFIALPNLNPNLRFEKTDEAKPPE